MSDTIDTTDRPDLNDRAVVLGQYLGKDMGEFQPFGPGHELLGDWLRADILCNDIEEIGHSGVDLVVSLLGEDFPLARDVRELWGAASALSCLFGVNGEPSIEIQLGDYAITWGRVNYDEFSRRVVRIDESRPIPGGMRRWFERAGIYQSKTFGLHRRWRSHNTINASSRKPRFAAGTQDGVRHFRVLPHLDRMDICDGYFDRWANSLAASVPMPRSQVEFDAALDTLLARSADRLHRPNIQEAA